MHLPSQREILGRLEELAQSLNGRLQTDPLPDSPRQEAEFFDVVDRLCRRITAGPDECASESETAARPRFTPFLRPLVLRRIRDAQRYVRTASIVSLLERGDPTNLYRELLVDWWHTFAEPYWIERMEQHGEQQCAESNS
jgi:hypothetical protein